MSKTKLIGIADYIYVRGITDAFSNVKEFPNDPREVEAVAYYHEISKKLQASGLTEQQKAAVDTLEDIFGAGLASARDSGMVRGIQAYAAIQLLVESPEAVLTHIEENCKSIREIYTLPKLTHDAGENGRKRVQFPEK